MVGFQGDLMMLIGIVLFLSMFVILFLFVKTCIQQKRIEELEYALLKKNDEYGWCKYE